MQAGCIILFDIFCLLLSSKLDEQEAKSGRVRDAAEHRMEANRRFKRRWEVDMVEAANRAS